MDEPEKQWIITLKNDSSIKEVLQAASASGLTKVEVYEELNCLSGWGIESVAEILRGLQSVDDVSPNISFDVGPPDLDESNKGF